jgi:hypothetical protein
MAVAYSFGIFKHFLLERIGINSYSDKTHYFHWRYLKCVLFDNNKPGAPRSLLSLTWIEAAFNNNATAL